MNYKKRLFLSFVGPSGSGKSTCYKYAEEALNAYNYDCYRIDIAEPLREIQEFAYNRFYKQSPGWYADPTTFKQDGKLLGFLAAHFEEDLVVPVIKYLEFQSKAGNIAFINTDCRNNCYKQMKQLGFKFIYVQSYFDLIVQRRKNRGDLTEFDYSIACEQTNKIIPEFTIHNNGRLEELRNNIFNLVRTLVNQQ